MRTLAQEEGLASHRLPSHSQEADRVTLLVLRQPSG